MQEQGTDLGRRWRLHSRVALRPEPFGALAYHYGNRRLHFLRSPDLVRLVQALEDYPTPRLAFDACGLHQDRWPSFAKALTALATSNFLEPVSATRSTTRENRREKEVPIAPHR